MLPKIEYPLFKVKIPSTKKDVRFRPFLVKEEKILLIAKASEEETDIFLAIKQVVNNCAIDEFDVDKISMFDLEYIFLQIRAQSVNNIVTVSYKDIEDETVYDFEVNLMDVQVVFPEKIENTIKLTKTSGVIMKYPEASLYDDKEFKESGEEVFYQLIIRCIDKFYDEDNVYEAKNYTYKEIGEYIENLNIKAFDQMRDFILNQPKLSYTIKYKNKLNNDRTIEMNTLSDFFILR